MQWKNKFCRATSAIRRLGDEMRIQLTVGTAAKGSRPMSRTVKPIYWWILPLAQATAPATAMPRSARSPRFRNRVAAATGRAASAGVSSECGAGDEHESGNQKGDARNTQPAV
jgi:hypothetical protein